MSVAMFAGPDLVAAITGGADPSGGAASSSGTGSTGNKADDRFPFWLLWSALGVAAAAGVVGAVVGLLGRRRRRGVAGRARAAAELARRQAIKADHDEVREAYGKYAADVLAFLDRPALADVTVPRTVAFLHAMDAAADARRGADLDAYRRAVSTLKTAWQAADEHARKAGVHHLPESERAAIAKARALLEIALDGRGAEHERQAAYAKARTLLDGVVTIPRQAAAELEPLHRLTLTAGKHGKGVTVEPQPSAALWRQQCSTPEELGASRPPAGYWAKTA
ncbi:hypothetical protein [Streptomyces sp. H27-H5]|uniref:hypothetical protein n=1 Tax=Streptomyces sp. H27-H5 TaxID=2996460 RepID=UPI002271CA19|nr:hypothetical protein [Streptomyces sp. H27-H5]MCY0961465.1 hypothetical protein [Streptomyces sp. H27-H5]